MEQIAVRQINGISLRSHKEGVILRVYLTLASRLKALKAIHKPDISV